MGLTPLDPRPFDALRGEHCYGSVIIRSLLRLVGLGTLGIVIGTRLLGWLHGSRDEKTRTGPCDARLDLGQIVRLGLPDEVHQKTRHNLCRDKSCRRH